MIDDRGTHIFNRESSGSDSDEADLALLRKKTSDVAANGESIAFNPLKRETSSSGIDEVDHPIFGVFIGYGDVGSPRSTGPIECTVVEVGFNKVARAWKGEREIDRRTGRRRG